MESTPQSTEALFLEYLNALNRALEAHRDETPYKQIIEASEKALGDKKLGVAVYKDAPAAPHDFYTIQMTNGRLAFVAHGKEGPEISWRTKESFMRDVVANKEAYIERPAKLDWDWLKSRVGLA